MQVPFSLMSTAYKRKKYLDGVMVRNGTWYF